MMHTTSDRQPWVDKLDEAGREVTGRAQDLLARGNTRRVILRDPRGSLLVQLPLPIALAVAAIAVFTAPWLAVLGALAVLLAGCRLQVLRQVPPQLPDDDELGPSI